MIRHPVESEWAKIDHITLPIDADGAFVDKLILKVSRNIHPYPFVPAMSVKQLESCEKDIKASIKTLSGLTGAFYSMSTMPHDVKQMLRQEGVLFTNEDKYLSSAGMYQHWPTGRSIFVSQLKDVFIWINSSEHFTLGIMQKNNPNLKAAFAKLALNVNNVMFNFKFEQDKDFYGYYTSRPDLMGSGLKIEAHCKLPYLSTEEAFRTDLLDQHGLECFRPRDHLLQKCGLYVISNKRTFGLDESEILSNMHHGLREIIAIESKFNNAKADL